MAAKRLRDDFEEDPDQPDDKRVRRLPSFSTVIREAMMMRSWQNLLKGLEPVLRRVVQEEIERGLVRSPRYIDRAAQMRIEPPQPAPAAWKLAFKKPPQLPIFTGSRIEDGDRNALQLVLVDTNHGSPSSLPASLRVELVPLYGDFPPDGREDWTADEFQKGVVKERPGKRPLLTGDISPTMRDGAVTIQELQFTDNSSWIRCRKFRIGARVVPGSYDGPSIREAMTDAFVVRDHRGELYKKHYPPALGDDVWRLEKIGKEGAFHRKLAAESIKTVQDFLKLLVTSPDQLRAIMGDGMTDRMWEATTSHAKTCVLGDKVYTYGTPQCTIFLNSICQLVKIMFGNMECTMQQLGRAERDFVNRLVLQAYQQWNNLEESDGMFNAAAPILPNQAVEQLATETPAWCSNNQELDFQAGLEEEQLMGQGNYQVAYTGSYQWNQMFNMSG